MAGLFSRSKIKEPVPQNRTEALRSDFGRSKIHSLILGRLLTCRETFMLHQIRTTNRGISLVTREPEEAGVGQ